MMEGPFIYGNLAAGRTFTDREKEAALISTNFQTGISTILISPRRWGKSSLVHKAGELAASENARLRVCHLDMYNIRSEAQFYEYLAREVLKSVSNQLEELAANARKFLGKFIPKLSFSPEPNSEIGLGLSWSEVKKSPDDILDLAEKIAIEKKLRIIICIDEFQNITEFDDPVGFQKKLRSHWQQHQHTSYCLYGSKRHMMMEVFASASMPFYKFGDLLLLQKIKEDDWVKFITARFRSTGKKIKAKDARLIAKSVECHPYYVQQLAQQTWLRTDKQCSEETVLNAFEGITMQLSLLFQTIADSLSNTQLNFLHALLNDEEQLSSKSVIKKYRLGTSANISRIKQALLNKDMIDIQAGDIDFIDPVFKHWLSEYYFEEIPD